MSASALRDRAILTRKWTNGSQTITRCLTGSGTPSEPISADRKAEKQNRKWLQNGLASSARHLGCRCGFVARVHLRRSPVKQGSQLMICIVRNTERQLILYTRAFDNRYNVNKAFDTLLVQGSPLTGGLRFAPESERALETERRRGLLQWTTFAGWSMWARVSGPN